MGSCISLAEWREDRRLMLFEDSYSMWTEHRFTQAQVANLIAFGTNEQVARISGI